jgi:hypothetical protein
MLESIDLSSAQVGLLNTIAFALSKIPGVITVVLAAPMRDGPPALIQTWMWAFTTAAVGKVRYKARRFRREARGAIRLFFI